MKNFLRYLTTAFFVSAILIYGLHLVKHPVFRYGIERLFHARTGLEMNIRQAGADFTAGAMQLRDVTVRGGDGSFIHFSRIHARFDPWKLMAGRFDSAILHLDIAALNGVPEFQTGEETRGRFLLRDLCVRFYQGALVRGNGEAPPSVFLHEHHEGVEGLASLRDILARSASDLAKVSDTVAAGLRQARQETREDEAGGIDGGRPESSSPLDETVRLPAAGMIKNPVNPAVSMRK